MRAATRAVKSVEANEYLRQVVDLVYERTLRPRHTLRLAQAELSLREAAAMNAVSGAMSELRQVHERIVAEAAEQAARVGRLLAEPGVVPEDPAEGARLAIERLGLREAAARPALLRTRVLLDRIAPSAGPGRPHLTLVRGQAALAHSR